jgi:hypothetical protein
MSLELRHSLHYPLSVYKILRVDIHYIKIMTI